MLNIFSEEIRSWILVAGVLLIWWSALQSRKIFHKKMEKSRREGRRILDPTTLEILEKVFTVAIFFISSMLILQILGIDIVPILTVSGIGAAILGFASRDVIANFFGGLMIYITRPFAVCDFIELPSKKISGTIEEIGWYLTTIRDMQKKTLYIPNSLFSTELLINNSRMSHRRIDERLRFRTTDEESISLIIEQIRTMLKKHPLLDQQEQIDAFLLCIGPWGVEVDIKAYTKTTNYLKFMEIKQDVLLKVSKIISDSRCLNLKEL